MPPVIELEFTQASQVKVLPTVTPVVITSVLPLKLKAPSTTPAVALLDVLAAAVPLCALAVESATVVFAALSPMCHTPKKLLSHAPALLDGSVFTDELP